MRLVSTVMAALLALSLAVFPISGARSVATIGHHHQHSAKGSVGDHSSILHDSADDLTSANDCSGHKAPQGKQGGCCDMGSCHAFTAVPFALTGFPLLLMGSIADGDEQVRGDLSSHIERPPRTA